MNSKTANNKLSLKDLDKESTNLGIGGFSPNDSDEEKYRKRMQKRKEVQSKRVEGRNIEKGLIIVFTGQGKGKTTAALGMALRTLGHDENIAIVQFIKGGWVPGEAKALKIYGESLRWHAFGEGFTWETQDRIQDKKLTKEAWDQSLLYLLNPDYKLVILDEINIAIKLGYLSLSEVINGIKRRPPLTHVVLTGRGAKAELIENADLVTEMNLLKHPFREQGVKAQKGIEF
ncbi:MULTISPECIES: cob(I)yrinic acid a,c-diamide adenosyltransferase [unclassified Prochlorococcus]|uniref:cob(I)yrinic acid a,c-diamide adenosyltransferase n=1 Tax=unclassified Prochlorococcus TaxID=2627481 RepID=UPI000533ADAB|nr:MULTISPECIES: cob(I)yrinic acid a,c-diamide adenosyltransferase [unclassified Prochlorococcus]KGG16435.1 Cob(I)alamin adenosyltransferase [Prochlorococcus sp. MIT 0602]KGG17091.1 Cob(I)alamin adenosyltransferase [Prochlorococcus sp. MIT 0603]